MERYYISSPDTVVEASDKVEAIVDAYVQLLLKPNWSTEERHWYSVAHKFLELSADTMKNENELTATDVLDRVQIPYHEQAKDGKQIDP